MTVGRLMLAVALAACCQYLHAAAEPPVREGRLPSFAELEASGAVIGAILVDARDVFDDADPRENYGLYKLLNKLHIETRQSVIRRQLLFRSGERVSVRVIEEAERLLRSN